MIDSSVFIHPSSIVEKGAVLRSEVYIGPFCFIGAKVEIGEKTILKSHIVVDGITKIGKKNQIYSFTSLGEINQDLKYLGEKTYVEIGNNNQIRESVTIHRGTKQGGGITKIGNNNLLMVNSHIAHDCTIGNNCIMANHTTLGGHVTIEDHVVIGGMTAIHQFCLIGTNVMIGGCSGVTKDVPPYLIVQGNHATEYGLNIKGLKRRGFKKKDLFIIKKAYQILYKKGNSLQQAKYKLMRLSKENSIIEKFLQFLKKSKRGIIR
ncbi:acyl-ACP--UDP-N-acetylglucosamine O-acyltransferase [bacterium endosymbiont of Pedicinus badii]|uniref:acyl-ACP--UDP-N-acetylglucosamine O-acyltransferase n=1 Tax=bacterium endosymbiont of Pedicinus badii TaxID=1719126 RepID=UPI0009BA81C9|nr:acyl-ACP--UDP-N-acetylglucosamine O-acyltransferase [bacterium endosymbiont of Pedicinus badii]OQM33989.1 UDP-N-acetylglucosamine acyltransferase [bacterium endosymbiont of Pedicinus badii]